ncbi:MAG: trehalose-6-phosphate synthase [Microbacteriaceae bacterium]|jgi:trehalose 6-phosphate synthase|nr:trehalose-6-phosphate synthase [Microbacteriaceae bacterium]
MDQTQRFDLVVVSNRLPVDRVVAADGIATWRRSPGGLVTALEPVMATSHGAWVGWPGVTSERLDPFELKGGLAGGSFHVVPVELNESEIVEYYEGFANATLWPLYHDLIAVPEYHRQWWECYVKVNERFARAVAEVAAPGATVWVQDYQLQLVPQQLRAIRPDIKIGFFSHIPFPGADLFAQLPWREQVLQGLLGADLVGFQRVEDCRNFGRAVRHLLGYRTQRDTVQVPTENGTRMVRYSDYPISIDAKAFETLGRDPKVRARAEQIRQDLGSPKTILLGIDRLDYTKGIRHRLKAFGELLGEGRIDVGDAALIQVAVPSRERVRTYQRLRDDIELTVARINGEFSTVGDTAVHYLHRSFPREEMAAFYVAADIMLVTALRDGMNLVAKEYVATNTDNNGALILSEFAGASDELKTALLVNPHDIDGIKSAILYAMQMSKTERTRRMRAMRRHVHEDNVLAWAHRYLEDLDRCDGAAA